MPYEFRVQQGSVSTNTSTKKCCLNTKQHLNGTCFNCPQCQAYSIRTYKQCQNRTCLDSRYCWTHLRYPFYDEEPTNELRTNEEWKNEHKQHYGVAITESIFLPEQLGLIATRDFEKGDTLCEMKAERMKNSEALDNRFDYPVKSSLSYIDFKNKYGKCAAYKPKGKRLPKGTKWVIGPTAPYSFKSKESETETKESKTKYVYYDSSCVRDAPMYANDPRNSPYEANAELKKTLLKATTDIKKGEEIFVDYGDSYWDCEDEKYIKFETVKVKGIKETQQNAHQTQENTFQLKNIKN